ncbi:LysR family transcriptional regulator [Corynebacterium pacaense]|uniref:LysR family transcriptional regulator n=1 Tax=Corynebacterium pacaense TaxID=1816684 RepID=UPI0009BBED99|nr:LysR family transcriptional regulator [Corynebacterium pacaense]
MAVTLRQLEYFIAVAECGTVTAASQKLFISQSAVSNSIADLEKSLNIKLFLRHPRGLSLSREGRKALNRARHLLRDAAELEREAARWTDELTGTLRVSCYSTLAPALIPGLVAAFAEEYPDVEVQFSEGSRSTVIEDLELGNADVVVLYDYAFTEDLSRIGLPVKLAGFPPYVLVPPSMERASSTSVSLAELKDEPFILFGLEPADKYFLSLFDAEGLVPRIKYRTTNFEVARGLVARGIGYSLLTQRPGRTVDYDGLEYSALSLEGNHQELDVVALFPQHGGLTRRGEAFLTTATRILTGKANELRG